MWLGREGKEDRSGGKHDLTEKELLGEDTQLYIT